MEKSIFDKMKVDQPIKRNKLRQLLGKEFYILKRKWKWVSSGNNYASQYASKPLSYIVKEHQSILLRPLSGVEMYLQENKKKNLSLAIQKLNGIILSPNEVFSFWKLVGRPSKRKGYIEGLVLKQGQLGKDIGGGLCQLGNLLFWLFAHSHLDITERYRHGFDVFPDVKRTVPFGAGATLSYNHIDLQVKNNTTHTYCIHLWMDDHNLYGKLSCSNEYQEQISITEKSHLIQRQSWGGYTRHNQIFQEVYQGDDLISEKLLVMNDAIMMYEPFLEEPE